MTNRERILAAADRAEEIASEINKAAGELREAADRNDIRYAYARLYHIRTLLGYVVGTLGVGTPRYGDGRKRSHDKPQE